MPPTSTLTRDYDNDSYRALLVFNAACPRGIDATPDDGLRVVGLCTSLISPTSSRGYEAEVQRSQSCGFVQKGLSPSPETSFFGANLGIFSDKFAADFHRYFQSAGSDGLF